MFRKRVPKDLQEILGKTEIKKTLGTTNPNEAKKRKAQYEAEVMDLFAAKRAEIAGVAYAAAATGLSSASKAMLPQTSQPNATAKGRGLTIQALFNKWAEQKKRSSKNVGAGDVSVSRYQQKLDAYKEFQGDILIGDITLDTEIAFRDHLSKTTAFKGKTINGYLAAIHALVSFAVNERYLNVHPLRGAKYTLAEDDSESWVPFDKADLEALFINAEYKALRDSDPPLFWMPIISLFTGARIEEIAQLKRQDVKEENGIYYFDINERGKDKRVKTKSSIRKVPIHPELLRFGLIEFVDNCPSPDAFIFPDLVSCENRRSHGISKWFGEYKRSICITDNLKVFHSFRHTLINACRHAEVPKDMHMQIAGHKDSSIHGKYGYDHSIAKLYPHLSRVHYSVDFSGFHTSTKYLKDIATNPAEVPSLVEPSHTITEDPKTFINLATAYQRIGKAIFARDWQDYEITDYYQKPLRVNLSRLLMTKHIPTNRPEIRAASKEDYNLLSFSLPTFEDRVRYDRIINTIVKDVRIKEIEFYSKPLTGSSLECPNPHFWMGDDYRISILGSWLKRISDGATWQLYLSPKGIQKAEKFWNQMSGANKNPRGGRKTSIPWDAIEEKIIALYSTDSPPKTQAQCHEGIMTFLKENRERFLSSGVNIQAVIPSLPALKKCIKKLQDNGKLSASG